MHNSIILVNVWGCAATTTIQFRIVSICRSREPTGSQSLPPTPSSHPPVWSPCRCRFALGKDFLEITQCGVSEVAVTQHVLRFVLRHASRSFLLLKSILLHVCAAYIRFTHSQLMDVWFVSSLSTVTNDTKHSRTSVVRTSISFLMQRPRRGVTGSHA